MTNYGRLTAPFLVGPYSQEYGETRPMRTDCAALCKLGELEPTMLSTTLSVAWAAS
jgi:hypothetical protein